MLNTIILSLLFIVTVFNSIIYASNYVAYIEEGYQNKCVVRRNSNNYNCNNSRHLFPGDKIIKEQHVNELEIKYAPYASSLGLNSSSMIITYNPPEDKRGIFKKIAEYLDLVKTAPVAVMMASRDIVDDNMLPYIGANATLFVDKKAFVKRDKSKCFVIYDSNGKEIFKKYFGANRYLEILPKEIGMKPGSTYSCSKVYDDEEKYFYIKVISERMAKQIAVDLNELGRGADNDDVVIYYKALYLQLLSDAYPDEIDLYWLSYELLLEVYKMNKMVVDNGIYKHLVNSYNLHTIELK